AKPVTGVRDLLDAIGGIRVENTEDFLTPNASDADLTRFGLQDKPAQLRIEIKRTSGGVAGEESKEPVQDALLIGKKVESKDAKAAGKTDKFYVRLESDKAAAQVAAKNIEPILNVAQDPSVLRNRDLVQVDQGKTDAVDVKNPTGLIKLRKV